MPLIYALIQKTIYQKRLIELGFAQPEVLLYGTDYDSSHRRNTFESDQERDLMGEGDLRYLLTKKSHGQKTEQLISESAYGSTYKWPSVITESIDPLFKIIQSKAANQPWLKIAFAANIQRELRILLYKEEPFQMNDMVKIIKNLIKQSEAI